MQGGEALRVLVVDDDAMIRRQLSDELRSERFDVVQAANGAEALASYEAGVDAVLLDWVLPDIEGLELFHRLRGLNPAPPVVILTAFPTVARAVASIKAGIAHFVPKSERPSAADLIRTAVEEAMSLDTDDLVEGVSEEDLIGTSLPAQSLRQRITETARLDGPFLVEGPIGSGRSLVCRMIHGMSERARGPYLQVKLRTARSPEEILFGTTPAPDRSGRVGLMTRARGGMLVLRQIEALSPEAQQRLADTIDPQNPQARDVRIAATSDTNLPAEVAAGRFSARLLEHLNRSTLRVPGLNERPEDIDGFANLFAQKEGEVQGRRIDGLSDKAVQHLRAVEWKGNLRELSNVIERAVLRSDGPIVDVSAFDQSDFVLPPDGVHLEELEVRLVRQALERSSGNRTRAGALLGLNRDQVRYRIEKYGLDSKKRGGSR